VRPGIARSFQRINIYPRLSVFENVQVALIAHVGQHWNLLTPGRSLHRGETADLLRLVSLDKEAREVAGELSYGKQKQLELAIALAAKPRLLLLDEPTAGMSPQETADTIALIRDIVRARGLTLLFTGTTCPWCWDHERISCRIMVRSSHRARPTRWNHPEVKRVYLGSTPMAEPRWRRSTPLMASARRCSACPSRCDKVSASR
jgi:branched-chain amino acid transport system ATP-binding protein